MARHSDGSPLIKVLDFGISKMSDPLSGGLTRTSATMGSALYMSPEQLRDARSVDHRTDIYALGVSLYEMLTGRQPFTAETFPQLCVLVATGDPTPLGEVRPDLPPDFVRTVEKAFYRDPAQRYQSVAELVLALAPWAPARSQSLVDRIARTAGMAPRAPMPSLSQTGPGQPRVATAAGSTTDLSSAVTRPPSRGVGVALGVVALGAFLLVAAGGAYLWHSHRSAAASSASAGPALAAAPAASAPAAPVSAAAVPSSAVAPSAEPAPSQSAAPAPAPVAVSAPKHVAPAVHRPAAVKPAAQIHKATTPKPTSTAPATRSADEYR